MDSEPKLLSWNGTGYLNQEGLAVSLVDAGAEIDRLQRRVVELEARNRELARIDLKRMEIEGGRVDMQLSGNPVLFWEIAESMSAALEGEGAANYVSWSITHPTRGAFELVCQRMNGERPAEVAAKAKTEAAEQRKRAEKAEQEREEWRNLYESNIPVATEWRKRAEEAEAAKNVAYSERNKLVAWLARTALTLGWRAGVGQHPATDAAWESDWRTIVFIDSPAGQLSWHFHDSEKPLLWGLPVYLDEWDGHTTLEKYERLQRASAAAAIEKARQEERTRIVAFLRSQDASLDDGWGKFHGDRIEELAKLGPAQESRP